MKIFRFSPDMSRRINQHESSFRMSPLAHTDDLHIGCMYFDPGDHVGYHPATTDQLFIVVQGDGWVEGEDRQRTAIAAGEAAHWQPGECHGAGTETGMTAIVVERDVLGRLGAIGPAPSGR